MSWAAGALGSLLAALAAIACEYNVRDAGFVDLGDEDYRLCLIAKPAQPEAALVQRKAAATEALRDCNIAVQVLAAGPEGWPPGMRPPPGGAGAEPPLAVLISPDGQTLPVPWLRLPEEPARGWPVALQAIASSPTREELVRQAAHTFAAILLIEGPDAADNQRARAAIAAAIKEIGASLKTMAKPVANPPALVVLPRSDLARERILLWSLGLDGDQITQPCVALVYGRARWIGPLMRGAEISVRNLTGILSIVGADCECDLDLTWTRGTRLPVRWDESRHAEVTKALGFDPESPIVKSAVSRILQRSSPPRNEPPRKEPVTAARPPAPMSSDAIPSAAAGRTRATASPEADAHSSKSDAVFLTGSVAFAALAALALAAGAYLLLRAARRRKG
jgi:hypothetical protein